MSVISSMRKKFSAVCGLVCLMIVPLVCAAPVYPYHFINIQQQQQFEQLTQELRCLVCQNENLADSNADLAKDLRDKVYKLVHIGKSNDEIKRYMIDRYGDFILFRPRFMPSTWVLWLFPFLGLLLGLGGALKWIRKQARI